MLVICIWKVYQNGKAVVEAVYVAKSGWASKISKYKKLKM
jgi:phage tail protein X